MLLRTARIILLAGVGAIAWTGIAAAATPAQIQRDAADGSIDGTYTLAEMRAADRSVSAEQREYYGWEDVYNAYIRTLSSGDKDAVVPAVPVDSNKDGVIQPAEQAAAKKKTRAKCTKAGDKARRSAACKAAGVKPVEGEPDKIEPRDDENKPAASKDDDDSDKGSPLIWLIAGIPVLIALVGGWRFLRARRGPRDDFPA